MQVGDLATWVGSVGIVATLGATTWQLGHERRARRRDDYRAQAVRVSAWYGGSMILMANRSDLPIYEVVVALVLVQGAGPRTSEETTALGGRGLPYAVVSACGPGMWAVAVGNGWHGMSAYVGAEIAFTDARGIHWVRRVDGKLGETGAGAIDHYGLRRPVNYSEPQPA